MASSITNEELTSLYSQLRELKMQNERLRIKSEVTYLERELREMGLTPSPDETHIKNRTAEVSDRWRVFPASPNKLKTSSPKQLFMAGSTRDNGTEPSESDHEPDRFVTVRRRSTTANKDPGEEKTKAFPKRSVMMKPATYDGTGSWTDYSAHFEACAEINQWTYEEKGLYLAVALRGQAQGVFGNLSGKSKDYSELVTALRERFAPPNQTELHRVQLRERRQKASENLSELAQDIRRLTNLAYPTAPGDVKETLAKEQFIDALHSSEIRLRVKQARPANLNDAVRHAVELEAFERAERKKKQGHGTLYSASKPISDNSGSGNSELQSLRELVVSMRKELMELKSKVSAGSRFERGTSRNFRESRMQRETPSYRRKCFECGSEQHIKFNCPRLKSTKSEKLVTEDQNKPKEHTAKSSSRKGSGLYVSAKINGCKVECLVDTGATMTLVSYKFWQFISKDNTDLQELHVDIVSAGGELLDIKGKTTMILEINEIRFETDVVVACIDSDFIIGIDFLKKNKCSIDVENDLIHIANKSCKLHCDGPIGCYRVLVSEKVDMPPRSEMIVKGKIAAPFASRDVCCLIEPVPKLYEDGRGLVGRCVTECKSSVPLRMMNLTNETQTIYPGTHVATASAISEVQIQGSCTNVPSKTKLPGHLRDLYDRTIKGLDMTQHKQVEDLLFKYSDIFSASDGDLGRSGIFKHRIPTGTTRPIKQPFRRVPLHMNDEVDKEIEEMLQKDVIEPSKSPWSSGIVLVKKKDGTQRFCVDYRQLNDITTKDAYPLPRVDESLDQLAGNKWFSCLDLNSGYWQVEVDEHDREKTAFSCRKGLYQFKVMPFGLCNAPATFERLMETVLSGLHWNICLIYLDDIIVTGVTFEDMVKNLSSVFDRFMKAGLKLKPRKCQLFSKEVEFLGHKITAEGIMTDPKKTDSVRNWPTPACVRDVRSFLGFCSYYRRFISRFAEIAKPLHQMTEKGNKFIWTETCHIAFEYLKQRLVQAPILAHPDFKQSFILDTDASDLAIGAVLSQKIDGEERVIAYASRTLSKSERRYCVTRKELLALVHFTKYFRHYLYGRKFLARTDHSSLRWLMNFKNPEGQVARWLETLASFEMKIEHRPGRLHKNADGLSRQSCKQCGLDCQPSQPDIVNNTVVQHRLNEIKTMCDDTKDGLLATQKQDEYIRSVKE